MGIYLIIFIVAYCSNELKKNKEPINVWLLQVRYIVLHRFCISYLFNPVPVLFAFWLLDSGHLPPVYRLWSVHETGFLVGNGRCSFYHPCTCSTGDNHEHSRHKIHLQASSNWRSLAHYQVHAKGEQNIA